MARYRNQTAYGGDINLALAYLIVGLTSALLWSLIFKGVAWVLS